MCPLQDPPSKHTLRRRILGTGRAGPRIDLRGGAIHDEEPAPEGAAAAPNDAAKDDTKAGRRRHAAASLRIAPGYERTVIKRGRKKKNGPHKGRDQRRGQFSRYTRRLGQAWGHLFSTIMPAFERADERRRTAVTRAWHVRNEHVSFILRLTILEECLTKLLPPLTST